MLAVHLENGACRRVREASTCRPGPPGFALLRLLVAGICNTDLELRRGYYGFSGTPGHEFVARWSEADSPALVGRRVVGEINLACGDCQWCRKRAGPALPAAARCWESCSIRAHSRNTSRCPKRNLRVVPERCPPSARCSPSRWRRPARFWTRCRFRCGETVAVLGDGKLGLLVALVLDAHGTRCACSEGTRRSWASPRARELQRTWRGERPAGRSAGWWRPAASRGLAHGGRHDAPARDRDSEIDGARSGFDRRGARRGE